VQLLLPLVMRNEALIAVEAPTMAPTLAPATAAAVVAAPMAAAAPATAAVVAAPSLAAIVLPGREDTPAVPPVIEQGVAGQGESPLWLALAALVVLPAGIGMVGFVVWWVVRKAA
jgi:hypothetical protein